MALPVPYDSLPGDLQETLVRSHVEFEKGWKGITLLDYLKLVDKNGILDVVKQVHARCSKASSALWGHLDCIVGGWTYEAGQQISQGFNFTTKNADAMLSFMKGLTTFCQDGVNCHGPRDTFRELITAGPGLHVCITQTAARETNPHDIHIDKFQTVCKRKADGFCDYEYFDKQMVEHMKDVVPWWLGERLKEVGKVIAEHPPERGPKY